MDPIWSSAIIFVSSLAAGFLGALSGLGGGVVIVPLLTIFFHIDIHYAIGASLVSVIATSSGAAAAYAREGYSNIRIGMFLEIATTCGALVGAWLTTVAPSRWIGLLFGVVLLYSAYISLWRTQEKIAISQDPLAIKLNLRGTLLEGQQPGREYVAERVPLGFGIMGLAGALSGLLGIGSGAVKVIALDEAMRLPFKVSTTTSNFMIGVTAAASAGLYLHRGYLAPTLAMPVMLGVLCGSTAGDWTLMHAPVKTLRIVFSVAIIVLGSEMIFNSLTGQMG